MAKKSKKIKSMLKNNKKSNQPKGNDIRLTKQEQIKKIKGWRTPVTNWESQVAKNLDKLIKEIKKGYDIDEDTVGTIAKNVLKRVKLYQEIAELTSVPLTMGEATWAIQYEYIYQRQLFQQDTLTEEARRDINVHNLKYLIEQTYNRNGNVPFEDLKQLTYDKTELGNITSTEDKALLEDEYTHLLEVAVNDLKKELKK